ncbi:MAG TPA: hypothetical protein VJQ56_02000, partial [Blastocatellia bacterium]|nr:hypothetical protein [Blastocatellia bacterium]
WALIGAKSGELIAPYLMSEVTWRIDGATLTREETLTASRPLTIRRWWVAVPTTATRVSQQSYEGQRWARLESNDGILEVLSPVADWPVTESIVAPGDGPLGRGPRIAVPLHLAYESRNVRLEAGRPVRWRIALKAVGLRPLNHASTEK